MRKATLLAVLVLGLSAGLRAEGAQGRWGVGAVAGVDDAWGTDVVKENTDSDLFFTLLGRYGFSSRNEAALAYDQVRLDGHQAGSHDVVIQPLTLNWIHTISNRGAWRPFFSLGAGPAFVRRLNGIGVKDRVVLGAKAALGVEYFLTEQLSLGLQGNLYHASKNGSSYNTEANVAGLGLAANYFFGRNNSAPKAPTPAPLAAVAVDSDRDGVADGADRCPGTPAGVSVTTEGCPKDSDADGVADHLDKCPGTPAGQLVDETGCSTQKVTIDLDVKFDLGQAVVKPEYRARLDQAAEFMKRFPSTKVEVEGHTDNAGSRAANVALSQKRADAVKEYLVGQGISIDRVMASGYGPDKPLAENGTAEGRAKNRRVVATVTALEKK